MTECRTGSRLRHWLPHYLLHRHSLLLLVSLLGAFFTAATPTGAHMQGMFATKAEAEQRAAELRCKGVFSMQSLWTPCANERALHNALQKQ